jgi:hypothetical protein
MDKDGSAYRILLEEIKEEMLVMEDNMVKMMMGMYAIVVGLVSWAIIWVMDFVRDKRSKKIII